MKHLFSRVGILVLSLFLAPVFTGLAADGELILPPPLNISPPGTSGLKPDGIMRAFLGIPYRPDGVINDNGRYALFNAPDTPLSSPGLNCSGLVLSASRIFLRKNIPLAQAVNDRENDSGPGSALGHDWDFGFDLIMNISEGTQRRLLAPQNKDGGDAFTGGTVPTVNPHDPEFTAYLLPRIREDALYLVSFSKHTSPAASAFVHHHVGIIIREHDAVWLYSTTHGSARAIRFNLSSPQGLAAFRKSFKNTKRSYKRLTIVEMPPPAAG